MIKLSKIKPNPANPRVIRDDKFQELVKSIKEFPGRGYRTTICQAFRAIDTGAKYKG